MTSFRGQASSAKMTSPGGQLTALACHPNIKVNKAEELTYLSTNIDLSYLKISIYLTLLLIINLWQLWMAIFLQQVSIISPCQQALIIKHGAPFKKVFYYFQYFLNKTPCLLIRATSVEKLQTPMQEPSKAVTGVLIISSIKYTDI